MMMPLIEELPEQMADGVMMADPLADAAEEGLEEDGSGEADAGLHSQAKMDGEHAACPNYQLVTRCAERSGCSMQ